MDLKVAFFLFTALTYTGLSPFLEFGSSHVLHDQREFVYFFSTLRGLIYHSRVEEPIFYNVPRKLDR
jgi:hypothetical protein